jgi:hypothetical protein
MKRVLLMKVVRLGLLALLGVAALTLANAAPGIADEIPNVELQRHAVLGPGGLTLTVLIDFTCPAGVSVTVAAQANEPNPDTNGTATTAVVSTGGRQTVAVTLPAMTGLWNVGGGNAAAELECGTGALGIDSTNIKIGS